MAKLDIRDIEPIRPENDDDAGELTAEELEEAAGGDGDRSFTNYNCNIV